MNQGGFIVVKIGGELAQDRAALAGSVGAAVRRLLLDGARVVVVHGAGPQATALTKKLGLEPRMVGGRRVTDEPTLEVMKQTLGGQVSVDVAAAMIAAGVRALCTTGVSAGLVVAARRPPKVVSGAGPDPVDFGLVGDVARVDADGLTRLADAGFVPVLGSLCADAAGNVLNVNADTVAAAIAGALSATKLLLVSNVPGVLRDKADPTTRIPRLTPSLAKRLVEEGVIAGGMIPKVEEGLAMLSSGVGSVHIVGTAPPDAVYEEAARPGSCGTVLIRDDEGTAG
jgi:acetylglutamate kinase